MSTKSILMHLLVTIAIAPAGMAWRGYTLAVMWKWFIVPTFPLPALTIAQALGISAMLGALTISLARDVGDEKDLSKPITTSIMKAFLTPGICLAFSYPITWFMP